MVAQRDNDTDGTGRAEAGMTDSKFLRMHFATGQVLVASTGSGSGEVGAAKVLFRRGIDLPLKQNTQSWDGSASPADQMSLSEYAAFASDQRAWYCQ